MHLFDAKRLEHLDDPRRIEQIPVSKIAKELKLKDGMVLADLGCGSGIFSYAFADYVKPRGKVVGFDIQQACIDHCEKKKSANNKNVSFVLSGPDRIHSENNSFDAAVMILVAHELPEPEKFLVEVERILKPGARLALIEWKMAQTKDGPPLTERIAPDKLGRLLEAAGFGLVKNETSGENHYLMVAEKRHG